MQWIRSKFLVPLVSRGFEDNRLVARRVDNDATQSIVVGKQPMWIFPFYSALVGVAIVWRVHIALRV
jgi:hypothetical protein